MVFKVVAAATTDKASVNHVSLCRPLQLYTSQQLNRQLGLYH